MNMGFMAAIIAANAAAMKNQRERDEKIRKEKDMQEYKDEPKENIRGGLTMTKKFIEADVLAEQIFKRMDNSAIRSWLFAIINGVPAADVQEVRHGKWLKDGDDVIVCSECGEEHTWIEYRANYCEDCGARMDGEI